MNNISEFNTTTSSKSFVIGRNRLSLVALGVFVIIYPLIDPNIYHLSIAIMIGIYFIINLGLNLLLGNTGQISLGQAAFFGIGAYTAANITTRIDWSVWHIEDYSFVIGTVAGMCLAGIAGWIIGILAVRLKGNYLAIATLGFQVIISVIFLEWYEVTYGPGGFQVAPVAGIGQFKFDTEIRYYYLVWVVGAIVMWFTRNLGLMRTGRALYAIKEHEALAETCGVSPVKYKLQVFTYSAVIAGLAGSLFAHHVLSIGPQSFSVSISLTLLVMVVVGGLGSVWGAFIGTALLYILPEFIRFISEIAFVSGPIRNVMEDNNTHLMIFGITLGLCVMFMPRGLINMFTKHN